MASPAPYQRASRAHANSQLSKNTGGSQGNNIGLKTPNVPEKVKKSSNVAMTPEMNKGGYKAGSTIQSQLNSVVRNQPNIGLNILSTQMSCANNS